MRETNHGSARGEAERLVATILAVASQTARAAGREHRGSGFGALGDAVLGAVGQAAATSWAGRARPTPPPAGTTPPRAGADSPPAGPDPRSSDSHFAGTDPRPAGTPSRGTGTDPGGWATGSPECCACPVCRVITVLRDPSPEVAERLATGAGDFAAGVASLLRSLSDASGAAGGRPHTDPPAGRDDLRAAAETVWRAATRAPGGAAGTTPHPTGAAAPGDPMDPADAARPGHPAAPVDPSAAAGPSAPSATSAPSAPRGPSARPPAGADVWAAATAGAGASPPAMAGTASRTPGAPPMAKKAVRRAAPAGPEAPAGPGASPGPGALAAPAPPAAPGASGVPAGPKASAGKKAARRKAAGPKVAPRDNEARDADNVAEHGSGAGSDA